MQAGYGQQLREYLAKRRILNIVDFGDVQLFENATTYTCIPLLQQAKPCKTFTASYMKNADISTILDYSSTFNTKDFGKDAWVLSSSGELKLTNKLKKKYPTLKKYVNGEAYRGVITGLTAAFIIEDSLARQLVEEDSKSAEILYRVVRGRDVIPYLYVKSDCWLIGTFPACNLNIDDYPAIKRWLLSFGIEKLEQTGKEHVVSGEIIKSRKKTSNKWFETQDQIGYYKEFAKPKIMYQAFQVKPNFIYDETGCYCNNSMWILPTDNKALLGLLNSKMGWWLISKFCSQIQNGYQLIWKYFGQIPIALEEKKQQPIITLVDRILSAKKTNPQADTTTEEQEINQLVYKLYNLTPEEISIVEGMNA